MCLALNIYYEARSEALVGQRAVAAVTLNRVIHEEFPDTICEVVYQKTPVCQFSWNCNDKENIPKEMRVWKLIQKRSKRFITKYHKRKMKDPTDGALFYHAHYIDPNWSIRYVKTKKIGAHIFYKISQD